MTFIEESKKRFDEKFKDWLIDETRYDIGFPIIESNNWKELKALLASEIQRFADEAIKEMGHLRKRSKKYYNETGNTVSMLARGRVDGNNEAISKAQDILKGMRG